MVQKWTEENIKNNLQDIINNIGHFPSVTELDSINKYGLRHAIYKHGGINKFRKLLGFKCVRSPRRYWNDETIINNLNHIINELNHFPLQRELEKLKRFDLLVAINRHGGINRFRVLLGYDINKNTFNTIKKPHSYWKEETIIKEINDIIKNIKHFPTCCELEFINRQDLLDAIHRHGGINKFRKLMGYDYIQKPEGYWNDQTITKELQEIIKELGHFPCVEELVYMNRQNILSAIQRNGRINKFRELCGYDVSLYDKYISELLSYCSRRGKKTEVLVNEVLKDYCIFHSLPDPIYNKKLSQGNTIEFICKTGKTTGIDVTNTKTKRCISRKWTHKSYHTHLDELWIVVFSDSFTDQDYIRWNSQSPSNVKVMSIYTFLKELDYSLSIDLKNKIDKYCECTFHTKDELKRQI